MTTINVDAPTMTLVNIFDVQPENADELLAVLTRATDEVMRHIPGFLSANLHMADDRTHVVNYAQWRSLEHFQAMLQRDDAREHMGRAKALCDRFTPVVCKPVHVVTAEMS